MIVPQQESTSEARGAAWIKVRRVLLAFALFLFCLHPGNVSAADVTTECPLTKPGQPKVKFRYGEPLPEGIPAAGGGNPEYTEKDGLLYVKDVYSTQPLYNSFIECRYRDGAVINIPIPGGLLHCGAVIRELGYSPPRSEWLRVWCISQVP